MPGRERHDRVSQILSRKVFKHRLLQFYKIKTNTHISNELFKKPIALTFVYSFIIKMPAVVSILYPREAGATFDFDYYMSTHMPLVSKLWTKHGMTGWHVCKLDSDSPYIVHALMHWESMDNFKAVIANDSEEVMADVKNYTNKLPITLMGDVIGSS